MANGGNALVRQAKRAMHADAVATAKYESIKTSALMTATDGASTALKANSSWKMGWAIFGGIVTAFKNLMTENRLKKFVKASKAKKQASQAVEDIVNRKDFMEIVNRYLRIKGKTELTSEEFLRAYANKTEAVK